MELAGDERPDPMLWPGVPSDKMDGVTPEREASGPEGEPLTNHTHTEPGPLTWPHSLDWSLLDVGQILPQLLQLVWLGSLPLLQLLSQHSCGEGRGSGLVWGP